MTLVGLESQPRQSIVMLSVQQQSAGPQGYAEFAQRGAVIVQAAGSTAEGLKSQKKKMYTGAAPASVARRNARERNRVKQVNNGFATLRQHIPQSLAQALGAEEAQPPSPASNTAAGRAAASKKLSKVETLRMAVEYIKNLQQLLDEHDAERMGVSPKQEHQAPDTPTSIKFEFKSESSGEDEPYPHHQSSSQSQMHQSHQSGMSPVYIAAPCSEASSSPTPSFVSDASSAGGSQGYGTTFNGMYAPVHHTHGYENYEPMSPEDEELLDYISLWQHGQ